MKFFSWLALFSPASLPMVAGKGLWSSSPATFENLIKETYPIGNGRLGGMSDNSAGIFGFLTNPSHAIWSSRSRESGPQY